MDLKEKYLKKLQNYYNEQGLLVQYPSKRPLRDLILQKVYESFDFERMYSEKEVNEVTKSFIAYSDYEFIRRELIEFQYLKRLSDGSKYWKNERD